MKLNKTVGAAAVAVLALTAFAGTASATTLETNGVIQTGAVTINASLKGSTLIKDTSTSTTTTCIESSIKGTTTVFTGTTVSAPLSTLSFSNCTHEPVVVHKLGSLSFERIGTTTNATVRSSGAEITVPITVFGTTLTATCTTSNTDIGTLTGAGGGGTSTLDINGVLGCASILPSAQWTGTYAITGHALGAGA
jgi:hypothetical protein